MIAALVVTSAVVLGFLAWRATAPGSVEKALEGYEQVRMDGVAVSYEDDGAVKLAANSVREGAPAPVIDVYEDFSCAHCAELSEVDSESLRSAVKNGDAVLNIRSLVFMDRGTEGSSTHGASAARAAAEVGDVSAYWNLREMLMAYQSDAARWDKEAYAAALDKFGESPKAAERYAENVAEPGKDMGEKNSDKLRDLAGAVSTPHVYVDGEEVNVRNAAGEFLDWVPSVLNQ